VIHYLNDHSATVARIQNLSTEGIALSFISLAELYEGVFYSRGPQQSEQALQAFLRGVDVLDDHRIFDTRPQRPKMAIARLSRSRTLLRVLGNPRTSQCARRSLAKENGTT